MRWICGFGASGIGFDSFLITCHTFAACVPHVKLTEQQQAQTRAAAVSTDLRPMGRGLQQSLGHQVCKMPAADNFKSQHPHLVQLLVTASVPDPTLALPRT